MNRWRYFQLTGRRPARRQEATAPAHHEEVMPFDQTTTARSDGRHPARHHHQGGVRMDEQLIEALSDKVHQGWAAEKQRQGFADHVFRAGTCNNPYRYNPAVRDESACQMPSDKHHTDMLPYADLAEHIKAYDRATVRAVLSALDEVGYEVRPRATTTVPANEKAPTR